MRKLLVATRRKGKFEEIQELLGNLPIKLLTLDEVRKIPPDFDVKETGKTLKENAILKAKTFGKMAGLLTLTDDSGLFVEALPGKLGVKSKRYKKGTDKDRHRELLKELKGLSLMDRKAKFVCTVALYSPENDKLITRYGECKGYIAQKPKGKHGFGYDPVFVVDSLGKHFAELTRGEKNEVSHRAVAVRKIKKLVARNLKTQNSNVKTTT